MYALTHWGRVTHICVSKLTIIGADNGLSPDRRLAIIWTNTGILLIGTLGTNFPEILSKNYTFSFKKMHLKMSSEKWRQFHIGLNVLNILPPCKFYHYYPTMYRLLLIDQSFCIIPTHWATGMCSSKYSCLIFGEWILRILYYIVFIWVSAHLAESQYPNHFN